MADLTIKFYGPKDLIPGQVIKTQIDGEEKPYKVDTVRETRVLTEANPKGDWTTEVDLTIV